MVEERTPSPVYSGLEAPNRLRIFENRSLYTKVVDPEVGRVWGHQGYLIFAARSGLSRGSFTTRRSHGGRSLSIWDTIG